MTQGHLSSCWSTEVLLKEQTINYRRQICFDFFFFLIKNFKVQIRMQLPPQFSLNNNPERSFFHLCFHLELLVNDL